MSHKVFKEEAQMNASLVRVLKEIRTNMDLTQSELEVKLGLNNEYISKIERGKTKVNLDLLRKFTIVFNLSISDILIRAERYAI